MKQLRYAGMAMATLLAGCIVSDEVTTLTIRPDGQADLVAFTSNVRSTEQGTKADEELRRYADEFDARKNEDFARIEQAGGRIVDTWWVRRDAPFSNVVSATLPNAAALEKWCSIEGKEGELRLTARFSQDGATRRLSMVALPPKDLNVADLTPSPDAAKKRRRVVLSDIETV